MSATLLAQGVDDKGRFFVDFLKNSFSKQYQSAEMTQQHQIPRSQPYCFSLQTNRRRSYSYTDQNKQIWPQGECLDLTHTKQPCHTEN